MIRAEAIRRTLLQQLSHHGWERITVRSMPVRHFGWGYSAIRSGPGGWPAEVWQLASTGPPQGLYAYLLFTSDRFNGDNDRVRIYEQPPETLGFINRWDGWLLRHGWRAYFPDIFAELDHIRSERLSERPSSPAASVPESRWQLLHMLSERQVRLFTCACLRRFQHIIEDERNQQAIEAMEQYADGMMRKRDMRKARKAANIPWLTSFDAYEEAANTFQAALLVLMPQQQLSLDDLLSDVSGNLGSAVPLRPSWLRRNDGIVPKIAQAIYADQSFADLPILADALEEAGCENAAILNHCRQHTDHARGCWVLDLLLGKS